MSGLEGTTLGRYRLLQRLGEGGMSEVYLAYDELMHRDIAIKVMSSSNTEHIERFQREAEAVGNLYHNHILPAFDYGQQHPWYYLVMPYIEHGSLSDLLRDGPLTLEHAGEMLSQIASALQCAHDHGILHRDIKPSNILLSDDHYAYLADFGLAKQIDGKDNVTHTGVLMGTPEYMAPELADGHASISSDIYALAILLYQMVTGHMPFTGDTALAVYLRQLHETPVPPSRINPAIPPEADRVILRALEKDPRRRYQTPDELAQAYNQAIHAPLLDVASSNSTRSFAEVAVAPAPIEVAREDKLVLPVHQFSNDTIAANSRDKTIIQPMSNLVRRKSRSKPVSTRKFQDERYGRNLFKLTGLMGISFMLIIMSIILFAVFAYSNTRQIATQNALPKQTSKAHHTVKATANQAKSTPISHVTTVPLSPQQAAIARARAITNASPVFSDDLSTDFISDWYVDYTNCIFNDSAYHVLVKQNNALQICKSSILSYDNAALQVSVSLISGSDAGIILRANDQQYYEFGFNSQGYFFFRRHDPDAAGGGSFTDLIPSTKSSAILPGKRENTLLVVANGSNFDLFINNVYVGSYQDSTYTSGQIGFSVETLSTPNAGEASFSNFKVFSVSS
ncbi:MAG TPA: protein kinase [Ktedonobacteraceae bacterium]|nr:protein kinase [Ktedonobacteraceae bacterium]